MAAAAKDIQITRRKGEIRAYDVAASTTLYAGTLRCLDTSGNMVEAADTADYKFVGVGKRGVDNSSGAAGDKQAEVYCTYEYLFASSGLSADDVGEPVYVVDNQTVGLAQDASVDNYIYVGTITEVVSATKCFVAIDPHGSPATKGKPAQYTVKVAGPNAAAFDLTTVAAELGGSDFYVEKVVQAVAYVSADGTLADGLRVVTTDYTLAAGVITAVNDESANTWVITFHGVLR